MFVCKVLILHLHTFPCMRRRSVSVTAMAPSPNSGWQLMAEVVVRCMEVWVDSAFRRRMKVPARGVRSDLEHRRSSSEHSVRDVWRNGTAWRGGIWSGTVEARSEEKPSVSLICGQKRKNKRVRNENLI